MDTAALPANILLALCPTHSSLGRSSRPAASADSRGTESGRKARTRDSSTAPQALVNRAADGEETPGTVEKPERKASETDELNSFLNPHHTENGYCSRGQVSGTKPTRLQTQQDVQRTPGLARRINIRLASGATEQAQKTQKLETILGLGGSGLQDRLIVSPEAAGQPQVIAQIAGSSQTAGEKKVGQSAKVQCHPGPSGPYRKALQTRNQSEQGQLTAQLQAKTAVTAGKTESKPDGDAVGKSEVVAGRHPADGEARTQADSLRAHLQAQARRQMNPAGPDDSGGSRDKSPGSPDKLAGTEKAAGEKYAQQVVRSTEIAAKEPAATQRSETAGQKLGELAEKFGARAEVSGSAGTGLKQPPNGQSNLDFQNHSGPKEQLAAVQARADSSPIAGDEGGNSSTCNGSDFAGQLASQAQPFGPQEASSPIHTGAPVFSPEGRSATGIGQQLNETIHASLEQGGEEVSVRLNPPSLGRIRIRFRQEDGRLVGLVEVEKAQTRAEIQQSLPQIVRGLQDSGVQLKNMQVLLEEDGASHAGHYRQQSAADWQEGSEDRPDGNSGAGGPAAAEDQAEQWPMQEQGPGKYSQQAPVAGQQSINLWM